MNFAKFVSSTDAVDIKHSTSVILC